jgi:hypothetical protein
MALWLPLVSMATCGIGANRFLDPMHCMQAYLYTLNPMQAYGAVAACGLAAGMALNTTVAPFILRGVTLGQQIFILQ